MRIQQLDLWNFKAFEWFTITLGTNAFLVGPNNAGKSVRELTGQIGIIPGLHPLKHTETVLEEKYVRSNFQLRRSSQHARNQLSRVKNLAHFWAGWLRVADGGM